MPKDESIRRVLIIGSGPIVIGQGCEFDYSGTQACRALRAEGVEVVLLNSNPATIMTDPSMADRTYMEPILPEVVDEILKREADRGTPVDALLPTLGGQTGLNCAMEAVEQGIVERHGVRLIGADRDTIRRAEDRGEFKRTMATAGIDLPRSSTAHSMDEARNVVEELGLPACIRPAYTLGGSGGGIARSREEFERIVADGLSQSRVGEVLIEEDLTGWKEFELEMMRDRNDNVVVVCSIENVDPMGVHTGDSITVAPALTLSDKEYQCMRDASIRAMRAVGVETGGSNIQFAVNPVDGRMVVIEMNPRVSRSSALASKATGFPIAKIATKLALGYTLDEIRNDITEKTPACFEPVIDYCVVKMPRFAFEKFPESDETLTTSMKSVGEAMAIGRTFKEAFQKCIRSMEIKRPGYGLHPNDRWLEAERNAARRTEADDEVWLDSFGQESMPSGQPFVATSLGEPPPDWREQSSREWPIPEDVLTDKIGTPCQGRIYYIRYALKLGWSLDRLCKLSGIDPWFVDQLKELTEFEQRLTGLEVGDGVLLRFTPELAETFRAARSLGYSDAQLRSAWRVSEETLDQIKARLDRGKFKLVDTCAAEFEACTPYYYATHERPFLRVVRDREAVETLRRHRTAPGEHELGDVLRKLGVDSPHRYRLLDDEHLVVETHDDELRVTDRPKVIVLGGGPNRIGQGIEFDYCCVHAVETAGDLGYETVMINSNPETVSTDYDTSDVLFIEPLTHEDVLTICERLNGRSFRRANGNGNGAASEAGHVHGVVVQFGGQTPLNLARGLLEAGVPILGTSPENIHLAEDRQRFQEVLQELGLRQPANGIAFSREEALEQTDRLGYPVLVRPSYVLGGRGMQICNNSEDLSRYVDQALHATDRAGRIDERHPILVDKFLLDAVEIDVDAVSDYGYPGRDATEGRCDICGIMEHIEEAGIHSGDSCCVLPPYSLSPSLVDEIKYQVKALARRLGVCGLMNVQFAVQGRVVYLIEVNPRASRTVPFVSKATGVPWAKVATKVMLGHTLDAALEEIRVKDASARFKLSGRDKRGWPTFLGGWPMSFGHGGPDDTRKTMPASIIASPTSKGGGPPESGGPPSKLSGGDKGGWPMSFGHGGPDDTRKTMPVPIIASPTSKGGGPPERGGPPGKAMLGQTVDAALEEVGVKDVMLPRHVAVKAPVFPFNKFRGVDCVLGPEMHSTGEVMGMDASYRLAFAKAMLAAGVRLPTSGKALVSVNDPDKPRIVSVARELRELGFKIYSTIGTHRALEEHGVETQIVSKHRSQSYPFLLEMIHNHQLDLLINTPIHSGSASEEGRWRAASIQHGIPLITTLAGARAVVGAIRALTSSKMEVRALQDYLRGCL